MIPRKADNYQTVFQIKTLLTSCAKPFSKARNGERISKAGKEYFHHAAKLQLRFLEILQLTKHELHRILHQKKPVDPPSLLTTLTSWFTTESRPEPQSLEYEPDSDHPVLKDKVFLKKIKTEIRHFEICLRLFEQTCIATIIQTQEQVQNRNIDLMIAETNGFENKLNPKEETKISSDRFLSTLLSAS